MQRLLLNIYSLDMLSCATHHCPTVACRGSRLRWACHSPPYMQPCAVHQQTPVCRLQRVLSAVGLSKAQPGSKRKAEAEEPADAPGPAAAPGLGAGGPPEAALEEATAARQPRGRPPQAPEEGCFPASTGKFQSGTFNQVFSRVVSIPRAEVPPRQDRWSSGWHIWLAVLHAARKRWCKHERRATSLFAGGHRLAHQEN